MVMLALPALSQNITIKLIQTSDVHGNLFPYDFINQREWGGSLSRVSSYVKKQRERYGNQLVLMDNGDILQGQPTAYYYNFMDTVSTHIVADVMNYMGYDVGNMGNHDIETGHAVYDRWVRQCHHPILGANVIDASTGEPYLTPYTIINKNGVKIAVLGMITPSVPSWLPENLWSGIRFDDMVESAKYWVKKIKEKDHPDIIVGLFHAGKSGNRLGKVVENPSLIIAKQVPGFDIVMMGHDHEACCMNVDNVEGKQVLLINPSNNANLVSEVTLKVRLQEGKIVDKVMTGALVDMDEYEPDTALISYFDSQYKKVYDFVQRKIGRITKTISTKDAYFGPSTFMGLIHQLQLEISGAQLSFCAPLSFVSEIEEGEIKVSDMFNLYKYENMLYVMELTGREVKNYLEMSYHNWTNQMKSADDHLLLLQEPLSSNERTKFKKPNFNFDSAFGIQYTVDVTKPQGEKITILSLSDGQPFEYGKKYKVALNSYRGNGGGELLTEGAGIKKEELKNRVLFSTDKDLRYYLMKYVERQKVLEPKLDNNWKFIPEKWTINAAERDYNLLFGKNKE